MNDEEMRDLMIKEEEKQDAKTVIDDQTKGNKNLLQDPN